MSLALSVGSAIEHAGVDYSFLPKPGSFVRVFEG